MTDIKRLTTRDVKNDVDEVAVLVGKHDEWINGNGKPGAKSQLAVINDKIRRVENYQTAILVALVINIIVQFIGR